MSTSLVTQGVTMIPGVLGGTVERLNEDYTAHNLPFDLYPDNSPVLNIKGGLGDLRPVAMLHQYTTYQAFVSAMIFAMGYNKNVRTSGVKKLLLPYLPGARQDKPRWYDVTPSQSTGDILNTLKFTVEMIRVAGFKEVECLDVHSHGAAPYFEDADISFKSRPFNLNLNGERNYDGVIAPDEGAVDRAFGHAKSLGVPLLFGTKHRDPVTNKITGSTVLGLRPHGHYLVTDDICDAGGTFVGIGEVIARHGATADLFVTHGLFTHGAPARLRPLYGRLMASDSLGYTADSTMVVPLVAKMLGPDATLTFVNLPAGER